MIVSNITIYFNKDYKVLYNFSQNQVNIKIKTTKAKILAIILLS